MVNGETSLQYNNKIMKMAKIVRHLIKTGSSAEKIHVHYAPSFTIVVYSQKMTSSHIIHSRHTQTSHNLNAQQPAKEKKNSVKQNAKIAMCIASKLTQRSVEFALSDGEEKKASKMFQGHRRK